MTISDVKKYTELADFVDEHDDIWISFDREADVIDIAFDKPMNADDSEMVESDLVVRTKDGNIVGITLLHGSEWIKAA